MGLAANRPLQLPMRVWDAPTRLFHWAIVLLLVVSYASARANAMQLHMLTGYVVLTLLLFRVAWGVVGSETARFGAFLTSPVAAFRYVVRFRRGDPSTEIGHNAAGGWAVLVMLVLLGVQAVSGLCVNGEDGTPQGPLAGTVGKSASDFLTSAHAINAVVLLWVIGLHILAVLAFAVVRRDDLVRPMVTGKKRLPATTKAPRLVGNGLAAIILAVAAIVVFLLVALAL